MCCKKRCYSKECCEKYCGEAQRRKRARRQRERLQKAKQEAEKSLFGMSREKKVDIAVALLNFGLIASTGLYMLYHTYFAERVPSSPSSSGNDDGPPSPGDSQSTPSAPRIPIILQSAPQTPRTARQQTATPQTPQQQTAQQQASSSLQPGSGPRTRSPTPAFPATPSRRNSDAIEILEPRREPESEAFSYQHGRPFAKPLARQRHLPPTYR